MNEKDKVIAIEDITRPYITIVVYFKNKKYNYDNQTFISINNQTFKNYEVLIIGKNIDKKIKNIKKADKRIKIIENKPTNLKDIIKHSSKTSKYITILEYGEIINNTYLETNIVSLDLNEMYGLSYTDTYTGKEKKKWNYCFENNILKDNTIPVPNIVIRKNLCKEYENEKVEKIRTWEFFSKIVKEKMGIHQSYYGFLTNKKTSDLSEDNYMDIEREIYSSEIINYPHENYYHEIIKSYKDELNIIKKEKEKKNILLIIPWMVVGGADQFNLDLIRLIDKSEYEITIITDHPKEYILRESFENYTESIFELSSFLVRKHWPTFLEYIIETRNIDLIIISNSNFGYNMIPYIKMIYPALPILDYIHSVELYNRNGGYGRDSSMMTSLIDKTITCSKVTEEYCEKLMKIKKDKLLTVYIGVDAEKYKINYNERKKLLKKYNLSNTINIGYICRIDYPKRPLLLAEIIKKTIQKNNNYKFLIGGDGPLLKKLKIKIDEYNLNDYVLFFGRVENTKLFYEMCDITINCSIKEGIALTTYESMSMEVPVVSANVGGHKELIDEKTGIIVPLLQEEMDIMNFEYSEKEINSYIRAIELVTKDLESYKKNCREKIIKYFSLDKMIINMQNIIKESIINPNKECINNAIQLKNNKNIVYEYINQYYMGSQYEYQALINKYYQYFSDYYKSQIIEENQEEEKEKKITIDDIIKKIHIYGEFSLIKSLIKDIINIILFPIKLLFLEFNKIKKIIRSKK